MATALGDEHLVVEAQDSFAAIGITQAVLEVHDLEQTVLVGGEETDLLTITLEPVQEVALAALEDALSLIEVTEAVLYLEESTPGPQGIQGIQGIPGTGGTTTVIRVKKLPVESIDGSRVTFTIPASETYVAGTLVVTLNGLEEQIIEVPPSQFAFFDAPLVGDLVLLRYQYV